MFTLYTLSHYHDIPMISPFLLVQYPKFCSGNPSIHPSNFYYALVNMPSSMAHVSLGIFKKRSGSNGTPSWLGHVQGTARCCRPTLRAKSVGKLGKP